MDFERTAAPQATRIPSWSNHLYCNIPPHEIIVCVHWIAFYLLSLPFLLLFLSFSSFLSVFVLYILMTAFCISGSHSFRTQTPLLIPLNFHCQDLGLASNRYHAQFNYSWHTVDFIYVPIVLYYSWIAAAFKTVLTAHWKKIRSLINEQKLSYYPIVKLIVFSKLQLSQEL